MKGALAELSRSIVSVLPFEGSTRFELPVLGVGQARLLLAIYSLDLGGDATKVKGWKKMG